MIPFLPLGCSNGLNPELEPDVDEIDPGILYFYDAMPLVPKYNTDIYEAGTKETDYWSAAIDYYEQVSPIGLTIATLNLPLDVPEPTVNVNFTAFSFFPGDILPHEVYALTSGHLHYLPTGKSDHNLLGGAVADEIMLILKPIVGTKNGWRKSHPASHSLLEECVYRNVNLLSDEKLLDLVTLTTPDAYSKQQYKEKFGSDIENVDNWAEEYLTLFKENPEIPLIVKGGEQIATARENNPTDWTQRLTLLFKMGAIGETAEKWADHDDEVKSFFKYFQRRDLAGHPMIANLLNQSIRSGTVDLIAPDKPSSWTSTKANLITDFIKDVDLTPPIISGITYHPLALDLEQNPPHLVVPREILKPVWLKISNPLGLEITIVPRVPLEVTISPITFSETNQVVEIMIPGHLPPEDNPPLDIETEFDIITKDGDLIQTVILTLLDPQPIPVRFFKLIDNNPQNVTNMDEAKLVEVITYANRILGQQANVSIYPVELNAKILHDLNYQGDHGELANPIVQEGGGVEHIYHQFAKAGPNKTIDVVLVWDQAIKNGVEVGVTWRPGGRRIVWIDYALIFIDTKPGPNYDKDIRSLGKTLVHEIGHWFSDVLILWKNNKEINDCYLSSIHFNHDDCPGGHWSLPSNLMGPNADDIFITIEQAQVYHDNASKVIPNTSIINLNP